MNNTAAKSINRAARFRVNRVWMTREALNKLSFRAQREI